MPDSQTQVSVSLVEGRPATTSLKIAEHFGKNHKDVLRDIRILLDSCPEEFGQRNFAPSSYQNEQGKEQPMYTVYFDGFMLLVMGYTGKKALTMKLAYIGAFNAMKEKLENRAASELPSGGDGPLTPDQQRTLQDIVDSKVLAIAGGSGPTRRVYYSRIWGNFNKHFRIAKYSQLPQSRLSEGIAYLVNMEIREPKELPRQKELPPSRNKYEAYIDRVEEFRARTVAEMRLLLGEGLELVDVCKLGVDGLAGFSPIIQSWLREVAMQPMPLVAPWHDMERAIRSSPFCLVKRMEDHWPGYNK